MKVIRNEEGLRDRYRLAHPAILAKARPRIDPKAGDFVAASPFVVLATTSAAGPTPLPEEALPAS